ncbi:unnamed protein product [Bursaphelenchus xylophilus]|uniref:(pine wood nematode) hypothetical protein n=1 Tax=Bursaphelenchus xylophilus TaxID=6326 RepID=A0A1I7RIJ3_BURXY|nr:unnamed protein product [Bursaphelenchus xylophilus]CAG9118806.1 unnamed protein product [Bursaphelenchus xylophilus]
MITRPTKSVLFIVMTLQLLIKSNDAVTCYQCEQTAGDCNETCEGTSCVTSFASYDISSFRQTTYCMNDGARNGCMGDMVTQTFYCYCTTNYCNTPLNVTLTKTTGPPAVSSTTTTYYFTPTTTVFQGRKRRDVLKERIQKVLGWA